MDEVSRPLVLAVDDDAAILRLIVIVLNRVGVDVEPVTSGAEAIRRLSDRPFAAIVLDLTMPLVSGFEVIAHLKDTAPHLLSRVVVITAMSDTAVRRLDQSLVYSVLAKPFDINKLTDTVHRCIRQNDSMLLATIAQETIDIAPDTPPQPSVITDQPLAVLPIAAPPESAAPQVDPAPDSAARLDAGK